MRKREPRGCPCDDGDGEGCPVHGIGAPDPPQINKELGGKVSAVLTPEVLRGFRAMASAITALQAEHPDVQAACAWLTTGPKSSTRTNQQEALEIIQEEVSQALCADPYISDPRVDYAGLALTVAERATRRMTLSTQTLDHKHLQQAAKETHDKYVRNQWLCSDRILQAVVNRVIDEITGKTEDDREDERITVGDNTQPWPKEENTVPRHCDEYIEDSSAPQALRDFLRYARLPAHGLMSGQEQPVLYADYRGSRVRVTMASRFGDVGIRDARKPGAGYQHRVPVSDLSNFGISIS